MGGSRQVINLSVGTSGWVGGSGLGIYTLVSRSGYVNIGRSGWAGGLRWDIDKLVGRWV